jgi:DNA polymerase elongation subunit (family B)
MGIVLKRRDNAPIVKVIYSGILDIIMKQNDIRASATFLRQALRDLTNGKYGLDKLIITKTLSSYYKDPEKIAHRVLADRMAERDPGNKPQVNERIPFVYFDTSKIKSDRKLLQGEKIETPDFIKANKLAPDYETYINNQIKKPVTQIFALCLDQIPGFKGDMKEYDKMFDSLIAAGVQRNTAIKKVLEAKRKIAEQLLFGDILRVLENKRKGNSDISHFFKK